MVVDDSVVIRRLVSDALSTEPKIEVVATASNGRLALAKLSGLQIDVMVLDIEMPELDGLGTLRELRKVNRRLPVIMFSTLTERGARATLDALTAGASDYVTKPANVGSISESRESVRAQLVPRILALAGVPSAQLPTLARPRPAAPVARQRPTAVAHTVARPAGGRPARRGGPVRLVVIGSSTGGPEALNKVIPRLPEDLRVPVLIVQHMPPVFTAILAERLDRASPLTVREAAGGESLLPGTVYLAPGDFHLEVTCASPGSGLRPVTGLSQAPPENFCRPSVDVLFRSAVRAFGPAVLGVMLTGMGSDGCHGAQKIVEGGGRMIAQDRETSVVWGMPGAVANHGLADEILPIDQISPAILRGLASGVASAPPRLPITAPPAQVHRRR